MSTKNVQYTTRNTLEVDALIRKAVKISWDVKFSLDADENREVSLWMLRDEVKSQITKLVSRALKDMEEDILDCNIPDLMPPQG